MPVNCAAPCAAGPPGAAAPCAADALTVAECGVGTDAPMVADTGVGTDAPPMVTDTGTGTDAAGYAHAACQTTVFGKLPLPLPKAMPKAKAMPALMQKKLLPAPIVSNFGVGKRASTGGLSEAPPLHGLRRARKGGGGAVGWGRGASHHASSLAQAGQHTDLKNVVDWTDHKNVAEGHPLEWMLMTPHIVAKVTDMAWVLAVVEEKTAEPRVAAFANARGFHIFELQCVIACHACYRANCMAIMSTCVSLAYSRPCHMHGNAHPGTRSTTAPAKRRGTCTARSTGTCGRSPEPTSRPGRP